MNLVITIGNGRRVSPSVKALVRLARVVALLDYFESLKSLAWLEEVVCVGMLVNLISIKPMLHG